MAGIGITSYIRNRFFRKRLPWTELFGLFKGVLEANNRALELITDMGEKLGGEFLFDANYVRPACDELVTAVKESIDRFDMLTQGRYPELRGALQRVESRIGDAVGGIDDTAGRMVVFLSDLTWDMAREAGGKNVNLAQVKNGAGLRVPEGFAITTRAFDEFIAYNRLGGLMEELRSSEGANGPLIERLRGLVLEGDMPEALLSEIESALVRTRTLCGGCALAVRSSAEEEDGDYSFAGQFESVLNVPPDAASVSKAYRKVLASLFSERASAYQARLGYGGGRLRMAVGCIAMVDAAASGVAYSTSPSGAKGETVISASWGLGVSVVDGTVDADLFTVRRSEDAEGGYVIAERRIGDKKSAVETAGVAGTRQAEVPPEKSSMPSLTDGQVLEITRQAARIERLFRAPQDIEFAFTGDGTLYILQARPLRIEEEQGQPVVPEPSLQEAEPLMKGRGVAVQKGSAAGNIFIIKSEEDLDNVPRGSVVVSRTDSANLVKVMPYISAIITDTGAPTSHMASLCREFRVPTVVNTADATKTLEQGRMVTFVAGDGGAAVYRGLVKGLLAASADGAPEMESLYEYRKKRQILRYVSRLNLVDPLMDEFTPANCRTVHDLLRFMHEKSVAELIEYARETGSGRSGSAVNLELPIPAGIIVVDIGGGLGSHKGGSATLADVESLPLRAVLEGMSHPGVWHSDIVPLKAGDFLSSMMRMPDVAADGGNAAGFNVAVASREYMNLSLRFGYHFNMLDCYMSENARNNHIYFRFVGGATDISKRSRRIELISKVLKGYGFNIKTKGDLIIARLSNMPREGMGEVLDQLGRLVSYTRQMDAMLHTDEDVDKYAANFAEGKY